MTEAYTSMAGNPSTHLQDCLDVRYIIPMSDTMERFRLSMKAIAQVAAILAEEAPGVALRVEVLAGGCNGFQYKFDLTDQVNDEDLLIEQSGARVAVDPTSLQLLQGGELDYKDTLMGAYFAVTNPNATASCGCGTSFAVD